MHFRYNTKKVPATGSKEVAVDASAKPSWEGKKKHVPRRLGIFLCHKINENLFDSDHCFLFL